MDDDGMEIERDKEFEVLRCLDDLLRTLQANKPNDRSEKDRIYAVTITDVQKVYAWFQYVFSSLPHYEPVANDEAV